MKTIKYFLIGALMTVISAPAMAQVSVADAIKAIKSSNASNAKETEKLVKQAYKAVKKDAAEVSKLGRAFLLCNDKYR